MPISIPLQLKRTTSLNRTNYTPKDGEPIIEKDTQKLYIGDGSTPGGFPISGGASSSTGVVIPTGAIIIFPTDNPPTGFLECDGSAISRTTYSNLFSAIGTTYGNGNGSTTFNIPDYRGYFLRAADHGAGRDPDASSRNNRGDGNTGDKVGTKQDHDNEEHFHHIATNPGNQAAPGSIGANNSMEKTPNTTSAAHEYHLSGVNTIPTLGKTSPVGGSETRPKNINVLYCIAH